jgi:hypothetical protein
VHAGELCRRGNGEQWGSLIHLHRLHPRSLQQVLPRVLLRQCRHELLEVSLSNLGKCAGTATCSSTSRSPSAAPPRTPCPFTRNTLPLGVPAGTLTFTTSPSIVGTSMVAPSVASPKVMGTSMRKLSPSRPKIWCLGTPTVMITSPGFPPSGLGCPLPRKRTFWPSLPRLALGR